MSCVRKKSQFFRLIHIQSGLLQIWLRAGLNGFSNFIKKNGRLLPETYDWTWSNCSKHHWHVSNCEFALVRRLRKQTARNTRQNLRLKARVTNYHAFRLTFDPRRISNQMIQCKMRGARASSGRKKNTNDTLIDTGLPFLTRFSLSFSYRCFFLVALNLVCTKLNDN